MLGTSFGVAANAMPAWLQQVSEQKQQQPEAMLTLMQQHRAELDSLNREHQVQWYYLQAVLFDTLGRHHQQQQAAEQGLQILGDELAIVRVQLLYELGFAREMQTDYATALQHYQQGLALANSLENEKYILLGQINQAAILTVRNDDQGALALLKDTYQRAVNLADSEVLAEVNAELGLLYTSLGYDDEAISLLKVALAQYEQLGWPKSQITVLYNLARTYSYLQQYDLSLQTYNKMLQKSLQLHDYVNLYHAYLGLAISSINSKNGEAALSYINKAEDYLPKLQSNAHIATHHYEKALIYKKLDQISLALQHVLLAEQSLDKEGLQDDVASRLAIWHLKAQLMAAQGEYERAYRQLYDFVAEYQLMRDQENELAFEQLRLGMSHDQLQQKNRALQQDLGLKAMQLEQAGREQQHQFVWLLLLSGLTVLLLMLLIWQHYQVRQHRRAQAQQGTQEKL
nr:hypothetical protein [Rheinheimera maricola]